MEQKNNNGLWIGLGIGAVIALLCLCTCGILGAYAVMNTDSSEIEELFGTPESYEEDFTPEPLGTPEATPELSSGPVSEEAFETLKAIEAAVIPDSDLHELGVRLRGVPSDTPRTVQETAQEYNIGDKIEFNASNVDTDEQFVIDAVLKYKTAHVYMWVEEGVRVDENKLKAAADLFENQTYPTDREFFGSEWTPGVDNDIHLSVLHARNLGDTVAGYFSSPDSYVKAVRSDSNEKEMFYINIENVNLGDDFYNGVLAHEFQHMIHFNNDRNEDTWLNEGSSELATALNNRKKPGTYDVGGNDWAYAANPDTQLTTWPEGTAGDAAANYGASYLFMSYFLDRFGDEATKDLVADKQNGMESVDDVLKQLEQNITHKEFFADWMVANLLDDPGVDQGQFAYHDIDPSKPEISETINKSGEHSATVQQYGADYIEIKGNAPLHLTFRGATEIGLLDTKAHSGQYLWWSNRADESDARLTRRLDLRDASEAKVEFWNWSYIEEDWDYAYVVVGTTKSGTLPEDLSSPEISWQILDDDTLDCTMDNPNGNSLGCGITGQNDDWKQLSADLTPFVGKEIALRFEYITDAAVNQPGLAIDDITITVNGEEILNDDSETLDSGWIAEGFVRHANILPQEWIVELITFGDETTVQRLIMADATEGEWTIDLGSNGAKEAVLIVSALAPITTEAAPYEITVKPE